MREEEYIDKALAPAPDIHHPAILRAGLRDQMNRSALIDVSAFARSLSLPRYMWRRWCIG